MRPRPRFYTNMMFFINIEIFGIFLNNFFVVILNANTSMLDRYEIHKQ